MKLTPIIDFGAAWVALLMLGIVVHGCRTSDVEKIKDKIEPPPISALPFEGQPIRQLCGSPVFGWPETVELSHVTQSGSVISWGFVSDDPISRGWSKHGDLNGTMHLTWQGINGEWVTVNTESIKAGVNMQDGIKIFQSDRGNAKFWAGEYKDYRIPQGTPVWMCVSGGSWYWTGTKERSNWMLVTAP